MSWGVIDLEFTFELDEYGEFVKMIDEWNWMINRSKPVEIRGNSVRIS